MKREPMAETIVEKWQDGNEEVVGIRVRGVRERDTYDYDDFEQMVRAVNEAVEKREAPLLALLDRVRTTFRNHPPAGPEDERCQLCELLDAIDALDPGEWVPASKYRELERVLGDLKEERRDVWRERCEKALAYFAERRHAASAWDMANILEDDS